MQTLFGGSNSSGNSQQSSASGFGALPASIQNQISGLATSAGNTLNPSGTPASSLFTLPSLSTPSSTALSQIQNQDFAVTPGSINSDITEQMNPYNSSVIGQIQQAQNGNLSQLNSMLTNNNAFGANRSDLGANDIAMQQANQVGGFLNSEYNTALNNALTTIPQNLAQSAQGAVSAGQLQQSQALQNQQAPVSALAALAQILNAGVPATSTGQGTSSNQSQANNSMFAQLFPSPSDIRLKGNIIPQGMENGYPVYDFTYIFDKDKTIYRGVMAQDIINIKPEAVSLNDGYYYVDYSKLGINFRRA